MRGRGRNRVLTYTIKAEFGTWCSVPSPGAYSSNSVERSSIDTVSIIYQSSYPLLLPHTNIELLYSQLNDYNVYATLQVPHNHGPDINMFDHDGYNMGT